MVNGDNTEFLAQPSQTVHCRFFECTKLCLQTFHVSDGFMFYRIIVLFEMLRDERFVCIKRNRF